MPYNIEPEPFLTLVYAILLILGVMFVSREGED